MGAVVSPPCEFQGAMPLEAFAISLIPGFQVDFPCIIRWPNLFHFFSLILPVQDLHGNLVSPPPHTKRVLTNHSVPTTFASALLSLA